MEFGPNLDISRIFTETLSFFAHNDRTSGDFCEYVYIQLEFCQKEPSNIGVFRMGETAIDDSEYFLFLLSLRI